MDTNKDNFKIHIESQNNFSVLNRIVNILNRRRIRIISLSCSEDAQNIHKGSADFIIHTSNEVAEKAVRQIEKIIEVEKVIINQYH